MKICDHTSVGLFVWNENKLLLIERANFPFGFAIPAGHVDADKNFEDAAIRELKEEVGLDTTQLTLIAEGKKDNPCRRTDGTWHYWKIYKVEVSGKIQRSEMETKQAGWYDIDAIQELAEKTEQYINKEISEEDWAKNPGLEPIMYEWFKELKIM